MKGDARTFVAVALVALGLGRMLADLVGWRPAAAVVGASMVAPAPRVFSSVRGLETYSTRFFIEWTDRGGRRQRVELDSQRYARLEGPYQRRNVFGAALAYGPVLAGDEAGAKMLESVLRYGLTGDAPLLRELGIDASQVDGAVELVYEPLPGSDLGDLPTRIVAPGPVGDGS